MNVKNYTFLALFLLIGLLGKAQDCVLDIGGEHYKTIESAFQLNAAQKQKLESLRAAFAVEARLINEEAEKLFDTHPQSTPEELTVLGQKYNVIKQKLLDVTIKYDKKLLSSFNEKQKERYHNLCKEAARRPLVVK